MRRNSLRTTSAILNYTTVQASRLASLACQRCRTTLEIHQPNVDKPDQFLAICLGCGAWFRIETRAGEAQGVMISLPEAPAIGTGPDPVPNPTA